MYSLICLLQQILCRDVITVGVITHNVKKVENSFYL